MAHFSCFLSVFGAFSTQRRKGGGFGGGLMKRPLISRPLEGVSNLCSQNTGQFYSFLKMNKI